MSMRILLLATLAFIFALPASAQRAKCVGDDYPAALCYYRSGGLVRAEEIFARIAAEDTKHPSTIRSRYFLVRIMMKTRRYQEASRQLVSIYVLSPTFYNEWSCDHLLGECRKALGQD